MSITTFTNREIIAKVIINYTPDCHLRTNKLHLPDTKYKDYSKDLNKKFQKFIR